MIQSTARRLGLLLVLVVMGTAANHLAAQAPAPPADELPVGYDHPGSDRGGPTVEGGLAWIEVAWPRAQQLAPRPAYKKPTVFFLTNIGGIDSVHELTRRVPMDVLHMTGSDDNSFTDRDTFYKMLASRPRIDCFVISRFNSKSIPADVVHEIFRRVAEDGTGFVMIDDFDRSKLISPGHLDITFTQSDPKLIPGIPYDGLRKWEHTETITYPVLNYWNTRGTLHDKPEAQPYSYASVQQGRFGKGTVLWVSTGTHWTRRGPSGRTLLPHISQRRDMYVELDYLYSHTAKVIFRAAGVQQAVTVKAVSTDNVPAVTLVNHAGKPFEGKLRWQLRDTWALAAAAGSQPVSVPADGATVKLDDVSLNNAGRWFLDVWVETPDGKTVDWGSGFRMVDRGVPVPVITDAHPEGTPRGQPLEGAVTVPTAAAAKHLRLSLVDRHWREVGHSLSEVKPGKVDFTFDTAGLDGQVWTLKADLLDENKTILARNHIVLTSPHTPDTRDGFHVLCTCTGMASPEAAGQREFLRRIGFMANRPYGAGSPIEAEAAAFNDMQLHPFVMNITHASNDYRHDRINDWEAPNVRPDLEATFKWVTRTLGRFGHRGVNLTDDSSPSNELPDGPYTTIAFHKWCEQEYGGLTETARAWGLKTSGFGRVHTWGRIHRNSIKAEYDRGNTAPWIDAQRFLQQAWVDRMVFVKRACTAVNPDVFVGSDAAYYRDAMSDLFGKVDYIAPYYRDYDVKVAVSRGRMRRRGDFGATLGSYGDKPAEMSARRGKIWTILFAGGTGYYYWAFGPGISHDNHLSDKHALYQAEVTEEVTSGIGELFTGCRRIFDAVAILDSQASGICDQLEQKGTPLTSKALSIRAFQHALEDLGLNPHTITGSELEGGWLKLNKTRLLVLPGCNSLSDKQVEVIRSFVEDGGTVVADIRPGTRRPNGTLRKQGPLDDVFGIKHNRRLKTTRAKGTLSGKPLDENAAALAFGTTLADPRIGAAGATAFATLVKSDESDKDFKPARAIFVNKAGKGTAVLLNASFSSYDTFRNEGGDTWRPWFEVMKATVTGAGLARTFVGTSQGKETPGFEFSPFVNGNGFLLGVEELGCGDFTGARRPFEMKLPGMFHVYEIRAGRYLGFTDTLADALPRRGHRAYALLPYNVDGVIARVDSTTVEPGRTIRLVVDLAGAPEGRNLHVVHIEATTPDGASFYPFRRVLRMPGKGTLTVPLTTATGDPPGRWTFTVTDINTGKSTTESITLKEAR